MHNSIGHALQFIVIFIINTSVSMSRAFGKNWHFCSMGLQGTPLCACWTCAGISISCIEARAAERISLGGGGGAKTKRAQ